MAEASTIALLQPPPSRCLASYVDSDWVLKQKLREEHGLKLNRHQRKNKFKLVNTDLEYHGDDEMLESKNSTKMQNKLACKAIIASGTGPDGRAEERKIRQRRRMMVRSVAVVLLSVFAAMAKTYFSPSRDELHGIHQRRAEFGDVAMKEDTAVPDVASDNKSCSEGTCVKKHAPNLDLPNESMEADQVTERPEMKESQPNKDAADRTEEDNTVCNDDEVSCFFVHQA